MKKIFVSIFALLYLTTAQAAHFSNEDSACGDSSCLDSYEKKQVQFKNSTSKESSMKTLTSKEKKSFQDKSKISTK